MCGGERHAPILEAADPLGTQRFLIVRCDRCGLHFTNPRPDLVSIAAFYPHDYHAHQDKASKPGISASLERLLPRHGLARLLDFGCGSGGFLLRMKALGWNVLGLDRSDIAVTKVRAAGLQAHLGTLPDERWSSPAFEVITMWQSLEHVHQPLEVLRSAFRLLTPGGRLLVAVPNFDSLAARWFGPAWFGLDLPRHLTHFTPATLRLMLLHAGFDRISLLQERRPSWIRHSAERFTQIDTTTRLLRSRLGSSVLSWCGRLAWRADSAIAIAIKS